ncbi:MAG: hypothetical protein CL816_03510 [Coxiellaceae bacterium]|nr:hypothetical protein [Coxiellaceae bacterium]
MSLHAKYTQGSISRSLVQLSLPAALTIFLNISFIAVDTIFLAHYSQDTLVAISFCFPVAILFQMIANGFGIAAASVLSRHLGANKIIEGQSAVIALLSLSFMVSLIILPLSFLGIDTIAVMTAVPEKYSALFHDFLSIWFCGFFFVLVNFIGSSVLRVYGQPLKVARIQIISCLINLVLSPILIFSLDMGIAGSALAGVIARCLTSIWITIEIKRAAFSQCGSLSIVCSLEKWAQHVRSIMSIAIPAVMSNAIGPLAIIFLVHLLARYGDSVVAGFGIAARIETLAVAPLFALSASLSPVIGQNFGATFFERGYHTLKISYLWCLIWGAVITFALALFGHALSLCFSQDKGVLNIATLYLLILPCSYAFWGIIMMTNANFNAIGKPFVSTCITLVRLGVLFIPLCFLLGRYFGYPGLFFAFMLSNILTSILCWYLSRRLWRSQLA